MAGDVVIPLTPKVYLDGAPLRVRFTPAGATGTVLFTSFHSHSQPTHEMMQVLRWAIFQL